ncbi:MAG: hypothetical protein NTX05_05100 [Fusobacteria bacterium]|nr:hypothetical protein [Fusobacteriota bacterium]
MDTIWVGRLIGEDALAAEIVYGAILYLRAIWVGRILLFYLSSKLLGVQGILIGIAPSYVLAMIVGYCYCKMGRWKRIRII